MAQASSSVQAVDICTVVSNAAQYDGKEILVQGLWKMVIHGSLLKGNECPKVEVNLTQTQDYKANKKASSLVRSLAKKDQFGVVHSTSRVTACSSQSASPVLIEWTTS
jgi:hypothetical protein